MIAGGIKLADRNGRWWRPSCNCRIPKGETESKREGEEELWNSFFQLHLAL